MKVLIIDNTIDPDSRGSPELVRLTQLTPGVTTWTRRAPEEDLPLNPKGFDRIIVSGSKTGATDSAPWIEKLDRFILQAVQLKIPYLGVCYGHQSLIRALGGFQAVRTAQEAEFGWIEIEQIQNSSLLSGLPQQFHSFAAHFDEAAYLPTGFKLLAKSQRCAIQACQLEDDPIFGIQFHPEKNLASGERTLKKRRALKSPPHLINENEGHQLYHESIGEIIFRNFINLKY